MKTTCPQCGKRLGFVERSVSYLAACHGCGQKFVVPKKSPWPLLRCFLYAGLGFAALVLMLRLADDMNLANAREYERGEAMRLKAKYWQDRVALCRTQSDVDRLRAEMDADIQAERTRLNRLQTTGR